MAKIANKIVADQAVTFEFANEHKIVARLDALPEDMVRRLAIHGLSQKLGDSYASASGVADAIEKCQDTLDMLVEGQWSAGRDSTGGVLVEALHRATGQDLDECRRLVAGFTDDKKKELKKHAGIAAAIAAIQSEKAAAKAKLAESKTGGDNAIDLSTLFAN